MIVNGYFIGGYQWLLVSIILMVIDGYYIDGYNIRGNWWVLY
jgi:hypothetical protein